MPLPYYATSNSTGPWYWLAKWQVKVSHARAISMSSAVQWSGAFQARQVGITGQHSSAASFSDVQHGNTEKLVGTVGRPAFTRMIVWGAYRAYSGVAFSRLK